MIVILEYKNFISESFINYEEIQQNLHLFIFIYIFKGNNFVIKGKKNLLLEIDR